jgi:hypothetical protein
LCPVVEPPLDRSRLARERFEHQLLVVAHQRRRTLVAQADHELDDAARIGSPVDVVAEQDQVVVGGVVAHLVEQALETLTLAVDVADRQRAPRRHAAGPRRRSTSSRAAGSPNSGTGRTASTGVRTPASA